MSELKRLEYALENEKKKNETLLSSLKKKQVHQTASGDCSKIHGRKEK